MKIKYILNKVLYRAFELKEIPAVRRETDDRPGGMDDYLFGDAPQQPGHFGRTMGGHGDQVHLVLFCVPDDFSGRVPGQADHIDLKAMVLKIFAQEAEISFAGFENFSSS